MPKKLESCVKQVKAKGMPESSAWPICIENTGQKPHKSKKKGVPGNTYVGNKVIKSCDGNWS